MKKLQECFESKVTRAKRIDTLLNYLVVRNASLTEPGEDYPKMTLEEIADFCGTDKMVIQRAEQSALAKFKSKVGEFNLYLGVDGRTQ